MYNLSTGTETQISSSGSAGLPEIYGDIIVWHDSRNGNTDIYMFTLASGEAPPLDDNDTETDTETNNETQIPDNNTGNGDDTEADNGTEIPDNESDMGTGCETGNESDTGTDNETDDGVQVPDNCSSELTPLDQTRALKEYVETTYKCHVKTKIGLTTLLDTSMCHYENYDNAKAVSMLKSFIHLTEKMKVCNQISADEADYMVREAKKIIDRIEAN